MSDLTAPVSEYLRREAAANRTMRGADHMRIMAEVAAEYGIECDVLTEAVLDASFAAAK